MIIPSNGTESVLYERRTYDSPVPDEGQLPIVAWYTPLDGYKLLPVVAVEGKIQAEPLGDVLFDWAAEGWTILKTETVRNP